MVKTRFGKSDDCFVFKYVK